MVQSWEDLLFAHCRVDAERISMDRREDGGIRYSAARRKAVRPFAFDADYAAVGEPVEPEPGTLAHFLVERYCLYAADDSGLYRAEIHHSPWRIRPAEATVNLNTMPSDGLELDGDLLCDLGERQDALIWLLEKSPANRQKSGSRAQARRLRGVFLGARMNPGGTER